MKYFTDQGQADADSAEDAEVSVERLEQQLAAAQDRLRELVEKGSAREIAELQISIGGTLVDLQRGEQGFEISRQAFDNFCQEKFWDGAVQACDVMFQADQSESLAALGQGVWLAVTFPVDAELTVNMLHHIVEETPDDSDGGAVAAASAHYIVDLRCKDKQHENLSFFTNNLLATVSRRHSEVDNQEKFDFWMSKLELNEPEKFLPRLRNIVDVMVQDEWWVDREAIWSALPDN